MKKLLDFLIGAGIAVASAAIILFLLLIAAPAPAHAGEIVRSKAALRQFAQFYPCPATGKPTIRCKGYVIDHIVPLDCGGLDYWTNLQWQTIAEGKQKDRWERNGPECRHRTHGVKP